MLFSSILVIVCVLYIAQYDRVERHKFHFISLIMKQSSARYQKIKAANDISCDPPADHASIWGKEENHFTGCK